MYHHHPHQIIDIAQMIYIYIYHEFALTYLTGCFISGHLTMIVFVISGAWSYSCCFFWGVLPRGLVQYCVQHSCVIAVKLFFQTFS